MKRLEKKIVLITGATSGIGEATAKMFAKEGANIVLAGRNIEKGKCIELEITNLGGDAVFLPCDVSNEQQVKDLINKTIENQRSFLGDFF